MNKWKKVWGYLPVEWGTLVGTTEDVTQRIYIRNNLDATSIKIKFTNLYDKQPLLLEQVTIGKIERNSGEVKQIQKVTYQGSEQISIASGEEFYSDSISLDLRQTNDLVIAVYCREKHEFYSVCQTWCAESWNSSFSKGNQTENLQIQGSPTIEWFPFFANDPNICNAVFGIDSVQVLTEENVCTIACFGDSITHMSFYFDPLQAYLYEKYPGNITLFNCGIGGNRILYDDCYVEEIPGHGKCFGRAGIKRFAEDVYKDTDPDIIFMMEGVNDCTHGLAFHAENEVPSAAALLEGICSIIKTAHQKGSKIYISTVMPFGCYQEPFRNQAEQIREEFNTLLRQNKDLADGFIDLDEIVRKPEDKHFMKDGLHLGDGVHPNKEGGKQIASALLNKFFLQQNAY